MVSAETLRIMFAFLLLYVAASLLFAHSDHSVWATTKTVGLMGCVALAYVVAKVVGRRLERRFIVRETFVSALAENLAPDYEI
jgi:predicted acyltransferase